MTKLITCCVLFLIIGGCRTAKDNRAVSRVVSSPELSDRVYRILEKQHPCINDTITKLIEGHEVIIYDTAIIDHTDTLSIEGGVKFITKYKTIIKTIHKTDTIVHTVRDDKLLGETLNDLQTMIGKYDEKSAQLKEVQKKSRNKNWWIGGLIALILLGVFLRIKKVI